MKNYLRQDLYFRRGEIIGVFFILCVSLFLQVFYSIGGGPVSILISSVNNSIWEKLKVFFISYIFWGIIEALLIRPHFRRFVTAKVFSLYTTGICAIISALILTTCFENLSLLITIVLTLTFVCGAQFLSLFLYHKIKVYSDFFMPAVFLLALAIVILCCFSVFPPHLRLFEDTYFQLYGIIPDYLDVGAYALGEIIFC